MTAPVILSCRGLTMRFGGLEALSELSLAVNRGEVLGLLGPNGSGKTTFFNVVTGVYRATAGSIDFEARDISRLKPQEVYRAGITRTFQRSRLCLPLTVFDNIMVGNHRRLNQGLWFNVIRGRRMIRQVEESYALARGLASTFSKSLADRFFESAGSLNMIDRRRVEICRTLISNPKLVLLDEPSAGMTHEETRELMDDILTVREHIKDLTIIIVEHEMNVIKRITNRCIVLNYGRKLGEGTYREIAANSEVQEAYLGRS